MTLSRKSRKLEHMKYALTTGQINKNGLEDISFVHNSLPLLKTDDVSLSLEIGGLVLSSPIFINAMTGGGGKETFSVNQQLAIAARECGIAMSVGSQMAAVRDSSQMDTYQIVRRENPNGFIMANIGGEASVDEAKKAVDMLQADALQVHLNVIQELVMPEGDRDFRNILVNIEEIAAAIHVPVIAKEVGFGMSKETVRQLMKAGVSAVDVGGFGGTNFAMIENERRRRMMSHFNDWGISTAASIMEAVSAGNLPILASGGLQSGMDAAKCLALGAIGTGFAGYLLAVLDRGGIDSLIEEVDYIHEEIKFIMTALGCRKLNDLKHVPTVISGNTYHWAAQRGLL